MVLMSQQLKNVLLYSSLATGSFITGIYFERIKCENNNENLELFKKPCLPVFATVSAATAFSPEIRQDPKVSRISEIMKYGFPSYSNIRSFDNYVLSYDQRNRVAYWVFEHLTKESVKYNKDVDRNKCTFKPDESIHSYFRSQNVDYSHSGYDRGHLAAAGNHKFTQKHIEETFYLSNIAPQVGVGFNRDAWNYLEKYVRKLTKSNKNVYCCTGPLYLPRQEADGKNYIKYEVIGSNHVAVPTHFFKVIVCENANGDLELESYVMPNKVVENYTTLTNFQVPPEIIERASGLLFFDNISRSKLSKINGQKKIS